MRNRTLAVQKPCSSEQERACADGRYSASAIASCTPLPPATSNVSTGLSLRQSGDGINPSPADDTNGLERAITLVTYAGGLPRCRSSELADSKTCRGPATSSSCTSGKATISMARTFGGFCGYFVISARHYAAMFCSSRAEGDERWHLSFAPIANAATKTCRRRRHQRGFARLSAPSALTALTARFSMSVLTAVVVSSLAPSGHQPNGAPVSPLRSDRPPANECTFPTLWMRLLPTRTRSRAFHPRIDDRRCDDGGN
jgi:hypothetical protein